MARADRIFLQLVLAAGLVGVFFAVPLLITLFPSQLGRLLHGSGELGLACASAIYALGASLPPLGLPVVALAGASVGLGALKFVRTLAQTRSFVERASEAAPPLRLARAAATIGVTPATCCVADERPYAYTAGLLRPRSRVSSGAARRLRQAELEAVLAHEAVHLRRRDPLRLLVARMLRAAFFGVPLMRELAIRFEIATELDADRAALLRRGRRQVAGALWKLSRSDPPFDAQHLAVGAWSLSQARIDQLCGGADGVWLPRTSRRARWVSALSLTLVVFLGLGQAARANLLPASALRVLPGIDGDVHVCPMPVEGLLL